jgi:hypothetical protein
VSKSKQRARATREAQQQAAARARAAERKSAGPQPPRPAGTAKPGRKPGKQPVYRQRRFPPLPWQLKLALAVGWLAVQVVVFFTIESIGTRIGMAIISLFALPLLVVILRDPSRRPAR